MDDIEAIKQLKARYFRLIDTQDWVGLRQVFADDVVMDSREAGGLLSSGADDYIVYLSGALAGVVSVHHGHMPEVELTSQATATGIWAMEDMLRWSDGREMHGYGHYVETYEKTNGRWRIKTLKLTRLRQDMFDAR